MAHTAQALNIWHNLAQFQITRPKPIGANCSAKVSDFCINFAKFTQTPPPPKHYQPTASTYAPRFYRLPRAHQPTHAKQAQSKQSTQTHPTNAPPNPQHRASDLASCIFAFCTAANFSHRARNIPRNPTLLNTKSSKPLPLLSTPLGLARPSFSVGAVWRVWGKKAPYNVGRG